MTTTAKVSATTSINPTIISKSAGKKSKKATITPEATEAHIAAHEANDAATPEPAIVTTIKLNKKEQMVLEAIFEGIHAETAGEFCYFDSFAVKNMTDAQVKGYISSLSKKRVISCDDSFHQIILMDVALQLVPADFLASFKHGFETITPISLEEKPAPTEKRTKLDPTDARRFGQIIRRVYRSRNIKVSVNLEAETGTYIVILVEGSFAKFEAIAESQFSIKPSAIAQDHSYIKF